MTSHGKLPPAVQVDYGAPLRDYWISRAAKHTDDSYAGVPQSKFPEDLRVYEHLIWCSRADAVIELGTHRGGSALWFRDRLASLGKYWSAPPPSVISVDLDTAPASERLDATDPAWSESITLVRGDVLDPDLPRQVASFLRPDARCLVVEDAAHVYETTWAALVGFAGFVEPAGFLVVEDGCVDIEELRLSDDWPRGVLPAIRDWLGGPAGKEWIVREDLQLYGVTCHPGGYLQRRVRDTR